MILSPAVALFTGTVAAIVFCGVPTIRAQSAPPANSFGAGGHAAARFWKTNLADYPNLRLIIAYAKGKHPVTRDLGAGGPGYLFAGYIDVPAGFCTLELFDGPAPSPGKPVLAPLVSLPASFVAGTFSTALVDEPEHAGAPPQLEVINDGAEQTAATVPQITIRNLIPSVKDASVSFGDILNAQFASGTGFLRMRGIKSAVYPVHISGTAPNGKPFDWTTEMDLKQHRHQSLLIYPDPYGRIRPRLAVDGEYLKEEPEVKNGQR